MKPQPQRPYRHERLTPAALEAPGTVHLHFDLSANRDGHFKLRQRLIQAGATPEERFVVEQWLNPSFTYKGLAGYSPRLPIDGRAGYLLYVPAPFKDPLALQSRKAFRLVDDFDAEPCSAHLKHVIAMCDADGTIR